MLIYNSIQCVEIQLIVIQSVKKCQSVQTLGQGKFIYIAHFIHSGNFKVLYIKGSEIDIDNNNKNKE